MKARAVVRELRRVAQPERLEGMARYGIATADAFGVTVAELRTLASRLGTDHALAAQLWESGVHEARILASMIDDPGLVTDAQMEVWAADFDSWDLCDQVCANLFRHTPRAYRKAAAWTRRRDEFTKRAGYALIAGLTVVDKDAPDERFERFLPLIVRGCDDERNYVRKGVGWALRQIGKRNERLHAQAIATAREIGARPGRGARWIARDVLRELERPPSRTGRGLSRPGPRRAAT